MATLQANGEIGQYTFLTYKIAVCANGKILRNDGRGWKKWKKLKEGVNPVEYYNLRRKKSGEYLVNSPCYAAFKLRFMEEFSLVQRCIVLEAFKLLSNDIDGLWSELNDILRISIDVETVKELCKLYNNWQKELNNKTQNVGETKNELDS